MCGLVDAEEKGEREGIYIYRPLPETLMQVDVPVPGDDSEQQSFPIQEDGLKDP